MTCGRRWWIVSSFGLMFVLAASEYPGIFMIIIRFLCVLRLMGFNPVHGIIAASECGMRLCGALEFGYLAGMEMFYFLSFQAHTIVCGGMLTPIIS